MRITSAGHLLAGLLIVQLIAHTPRIDDRHDGIERGVALASRRMNDWITGAGSASPVVSITM
jgi:hypothetical protein